MKRKYVVPMFLIIAAISFASSCKKEDPGDGTVPEIVVLGSNPQYWAIDVPYNDDGATAYDITPEGDTVDLTNEIVVTDNIDVSIKGYYEVKYNVTDESGVDAVEKVRDVKVVDGK